MVARRVARAGLTTGVSSDDTMDDLLKPLRRLSSPLFLFFSLVLWILGLRSDILFSFSYPPPAPSSFWALQYSISRRPPQTPKPVHISHLYPAIPLSRHTHTYYTVYTTHASILFCIHTFFSSCCISLVSSLVPSRFVLHSLFSVCSDRFALILFVFASLALVLSLLPLCSCFGH
jgi:hypothetical protein